MFLIFGSIPSRNSEKRWVLHSIFQRLTKLPSYGLTPQLCSLLKSFLSDRSLFVVVDGMSSDIFPINASVSQGSILAPTLFLFHINDLLGKTSCSVHSFADDSTFQTSFSSRVPTSTRKSKIQRDLSVNNINDDLAKIIERGNILAEFNASKTQGCLRKLAYLHRIFRCQE